MPTPSSPQPLYDALTAFPNGVNEGTTPLYLSPDTMAGAVNTTVRGLNVTHRSCFHRRLIQFESVETQTGFEQGRFQGACYYFGDDQEASLVAMISGRVFQLQFQTNVNTVTCREITITGGVMNPNQPQAWLWQAEKWVIIQDGKSNPIFFDGTATATRSTYIPPGSYSTTTTTTFTVPAANASGTVDFTSVANLFVGYIVTLEDIGTFEVLDISVLTVTLLNLTGTPAGKTVASGADVQWLSQTPQLPPGRMGCYGMGRNWFSLIDGKQFVASDIVGGASGTAANNFRDAVLYITENLYLKGGGNFTVPGSVGTITAMRFVATLDRSLGQGPLQVFTYNTVFSCNAPVDRLTWQSITNPILTESLISNGALGQNSTVLSNGDVIFRSIDGVRSLILARREFQTWGNVPISFEVSPRLSTDDPGLLQYGSAIVFDNRLLMTAGVTEHEQGIYFKGLVPLNFDPLSSIRGKAPSVWDAGIWTGLNTLQIITGDFDRVQRAFAFHLNTSAERIELWEIKKSYNPALPAGAQPDAAIYDNDGTFDIPVTWRVDSASLRFGIPPQDHKYMSLENGEIWIADLQGTALFQTWYRADQYPCWTKWHQWSSCQGGEREDSPEVLWTAQGPVSDEARPAYLPRMGLGAPRGGCDTSTNRPVNQGFTFQVRTVIQGHCVLLGEFFEASAKPMPKYAPMVCTSLCAEGES